MKRKQDDGPGLFDVETDTAPVDVIGTEGEPTSRRIIPAMVASAGLEVEWHEVPQPVFLSWSPEMQASYCAARDEDSALTAHERGEDPRWYLDRARSYKELIDART